MHLPIFCPSSDTKHARPKHVRNDLSLNFQSTYMFFTPLASLRNLETQFLSDFVGPSDEVDRSIHLTKEIHMLPHDVQTVRGVSQVVHASTACMFMAVTLIVLALYSGMTWRLNILCHGHQFECLCKAIQVAWQVGALRLCCWYILSCILTICCSLNIHLLDYCSDLRMEQRCWQITTTCMSNA